MADGESPFVMDGPIVLKVSLPTWAYAPISSTALIALTTTVTIPVVIATNANKKDGKLIADG
jgi:hypothetical protein